MTAFDMRTAWADYRRRHPEWLDDDYREMEDPGDDSN